MQYDIFISYRRETGEDKARILNQYLSTIGYRVFFDHESGMTGEFETEILAAVEVAPVFLMLLTPNCLDRCKDEGDWVRREIERATLFNKEIIPIRPNYGFEFTSLPDGIPDYVLRLSKLEFAEIDFHKNFKATANSMVEEQLKKFVQPSILLSGSGDKGAKIHFFSDISCRVFHFGKPIAVTDATDTSVGSVVRMLKGCHKLEYKSIEHEADAYSEVYTVPDNDYESFINIELKPIKGERKKKEDELRAIQNRKAAEEKERKARNKSVSEASDSEYDLFFCYSRNDAAIVRQVYHFLTNAGYRCWIDMDDVATGATVAAGAIGSAISSILMPWTWGHFSTKIENSKCLLFFNSEHSNQSEWALNELKLAIKSGIMVLPIILDNSALPKNLDISHYRCVRIDSNDSFDLILNNVRNIIDD